ncbi:hypothetical protein GWI33_010429, partial [Rhynchophorus ferrugineus]
MLVVRGALRHRHEEQNNERMKQKGFLLVVPRGRPKRKCRPLDLIIDGLAAGCSVLSNSAQISKVPQPSTIII